MESKKQDFLIRGMILAMVLPLLSVTFAFADSSLRVAKIIDFSGKVTIQKAGGEKKFNAFKGMGLTEGDKITTGKSSNATLKIDDDKQVIVGENTSVTISELRGSKAAGDDSTSLELSNGKVWNEIDDKLNVKAKYEIKTPKTVLGVRGTQFYTKTGDGKTLIAVVDGKVYAVTYATEQRPDGSVLEKAIEAYIAANQQAVINENPGQNAGIMIQPLSIGDIDPDILVEILQHPGSIDGAIIQEIIRTLLDNIRQIDLAVLKEIVNNPAGLDPALVDQARQEIAKRPAEIITDAGLDIGRVVIPVNGVVDSTGTGGKSKSNTDVTPPAFDAGYPTASAIADKSFDLDYQLNEAGTVYYVWFGTGDHPDPNADQVVNGTDGNGNSNNLGWGIVGLPSAGIPGSDTVSMGVLANASYDVFSVAVDGAGNKSAVNKFTLHTLVDVTPPVFAAGYPTISAITSDGYDLHYLLDEDTTVFDVWFVQGANPAPTATDVINGTDGAGNQNNMGHGFYPNITGGNEIILPITQGVEGATTYAIYLVATDLSNNPSALQTLTVTTLTDTVPPDFIAGYPTASAIAANSFDLDYEINDTGTVYSEWFTGPRTAPGVDDVIAGQDGAGSNSNLGTNSNGLISSGQLNQTHVTGVLSGTTYEVYFVVVDDGGNKSTLQHITVTTP